MKSTSLLFLLALTSIPSITITSTTFAEEITALSSLEGQVTKVEQTTCPADSHCFAPNHTRIDIVFTLKGCMDDLGPVTHKQVATKRGQVVFVNAINLHRASSADTACFVPKTVTHSLTLADNSSTEPLIISYLGTDKEEIVHQESEVRLFQAQILSLNEPADDELPAFRVEGEVLLGTNPCWAEGKSAELTFETVDGQLQVFAKKTWISSGDDRICTAEYAPVFQKVSLDLMGLLPGDPQIVIRNVEDQGAHLEIEQLL